MTRSIRPATAVVLWSGLVLASGCYEAADQTADGRPDRSAVPDEVYDQRGNRFVYVGPGATEENRALLDSLLNDPAPVGSELEVLAHNLRSHSNRMGHYYVEAEPAYELAEQILSGAVPEPTRPGLPTEERDVVGPDNRVRVNPVSAYPLTSMVFSQFGCSGTMIGRNTMITAAHCMFDTLLTNRWFCSDGAPQNTNGSCNPGAGVVKLRVGVNGATGISNWSGCYWAHVRQEYIDLPSQPDTVTWATFDHGVVDFTAGGACSNPTMDDGGWVGTGAYSDATIASRTTLRAGYPAFAPCLAGANGGNPFECPNAWRWSGVWPMGAPFTSAELWMGVVGPGGTIALAANSPVLVSQHDWTQGDSGSSMLAFIDNGWRVIGVVANSENSATNFASRWTGGVHNWVAAHSEFPADTM